MSGDYDYDSSDYVDVAARCREFFATYPQGSLRPANPDDPFRIVALDEDTAQAFTDAYGSRKWASYQPRVFVCYTAAAYRTPDDEAPGIGVAWEPWPGMTPYTHNSEIMNAETSAWGRAIVAIGAAEAKASGEEVRNRRAEQDDGPVMIAVGAAKRGIMDATSKDAAATAWETMHYPTTTKAILQDDYDKIMALARDIEQGVEPFDDSPPPAAVEAPAGDSGPPPAVPVGDPPLPEAESGGYLHDDNEYRAWPTGDPTGRWKSDELAAFIAANATTVAIPDGKTERLTTAIAVAPF